MHGKASINNPKNVPCILEASASGEEATMQAKVANVKPCSRCEEFDRELAGILTAIAVVSKNLVKRLAAVQGNQNAPDEGGDRNATG